jgi:hypothetical protein
VLLTVDRSPAFGNLGVKYQLPGDVRAELSARDAAGKLVRTLRVSGSGRENLSGLSCVLYFLVLESEHGRRQAITVVRL